MHNPKELHQQYTADPIANGTWSQYDATITFVVPGNIRGFLVIDL
jgi:hypothetical protein